MNNGLSLIHHPTSTIIIDDNLNFLKSIIAMLSDEYMNIIPYDSPNNALNFIENIYDTNKINLKEYVYTYDNYCIFAGYKAIYSKLRFSSISSIFTDYEMPGITGLDFLKKIKAKDIFKIMLTGIATDTMAQYTLEKNLIQYFIRKNNFNFQDEIIKAMELGTINFENKLYDTINSILKDVNNIDFIIPERLCNFIKKIIRDKNIIEYYIIDDNGSFLFIDNNDNLSAIFVYNKSDYLKLYTKFRETFNHDMLSDLVNGNKIICFPYKSERLSDNDLGIFIKDSTHIDEDISYTMVDDVNYFINTNELVTFRSFKSQSIASPYISTLSRINFS